MDRDGTVMLKTHFQLRPGHPEYERTAAFVFILRNPADVLLSNFSYLQMVGVLGEMTLDAFARDFAQNLGARHWRSSGVGEWVEHASYWLGARHVPGLLVRYEDLRQSPVETLSKIVTFLGENPSSERLIAAVDAAEISKLRALEKDEKRAGGPTMFAGDDNALSQGVRFINTGETRRSLDSIDPALNDAFDRVFTPRIAELEELARGLSGSWQRRFPIVSAIEQEPAFRPSRSTS